MKIVVLDGYTENPGDLTWESLEKLGDLTVYDRTSLTDVAEIASRIGDAEIVVTNKTPITKEVFDKCSNIEFIAVLATGFNVVDVAYAREKGVSVSNVPAYGTEAVAQFAIGMLLEICHHVAHHSKTVYEGKWENCPDFCYWDYPLIELKDKIMGIIGFGRIGQQTGRIAKAMGMNILATGSRETAEGKEIATYVDLDTLLESSDVIALHCPLVPENTGMINKDTIAKMKDGVIILNNSRGPLVVEQDLCDALNSGKVLAAGVDVVATEPIKGDNPLLKAKNCFITPHISWASVECRQRIMDTTAKNIEAHLKGQEINVVNA
ncbi:MAG: D-2-hydroxyacid dehydrogenase [Lachnospiraceae bacterium]|nr:D-2-hydroxyacid dehydrogenase [Lachnospiraceae bacterium]